MKHARSLLRHRTVILALALVALSMLTLGRATAAVTVQSFTAKAQTASILIEWRTASEVSNAGFNLYRSTSPSGPWTTKINPSLIPACPGCYNVLHSFTDSSASKGQTYYYRLENVDFNGSTQQFGPVNAAISAPISTPTFTPTTVPPTATRTFTAVATATATSVSSSSNPTATDSPTVDSSPTPPGTMPPTSTPFPTRVALFINPSAPSPTVAAPPRVRPNTPNVAPPAPPKSNEPVSIPTIPVVVVNPVQPDIPPTMDGSTDQVQPDSASARSTELNPLLVAVTLIGGVAAMTVIAVGAASFYLIARRFIR